MVIFWSEFFFWHYLHDPNIDDFVPILTKDNAENLHSIMDLSPICYQNNISHPWLNIISQFS